MVKQLRPNIPLLITMVIWGFNFVAMKVVLTQMTPPALAFVRGLAMYGCLVLLCKASGRSLRYRREDLWLVLLQGFLAMGVYMILFTVGMKESTPGEAAIILATSPAIALGIAIAVGQERFMPGRLLGIVIAFSGVVFVILPSLSAGSGKARLIGNLLLLIAAMLWACNVVITRPLVKRYDPLALLALSMPGGLIALTPFGIMDALHTSYASFHPVTWLMFGYVTVLSGSLGFAFFYGGVKSVGASGALTYQYFVPPLAVFFGWLALGAAPVWIQFCGLAFVLIGVAVSVGSRAVPVEAALADAVG